MNEVKRFFIITPVLLFSVLQSCEILFFDKVLSGCEAGGRDRPERRRWRRLNCPSPSSPIWLAGSAHSITRTPGRWDVLSESLSSGSLISLMMTDPFSLHLLTSLLKHLCTIRVNPCHPWTLMIPLWLRLRCAVSLWRLFS